MTIFEAMAKTAFEVVKAFDGKPATWVPSNNDPEQNAIVLFKTPTKKFELSDNDYSLEDIQMEYYESDFPNLFKSVADGNNEPVNITVSEGVVENFIVRRCEKKYDGKTIIATLTAL